MYFYYGLLGAVFFATLAMYIDKGLWSNTLATMNIVISGLLAFGFYAPAARMAAENGLSSFTYLLDFLFVWAVYTVAFLVLYRVMSGALSKTRMRFKNPIDSVGGPLMAGVAGWVMMCFVAATLHMAPFGKDAFGGVFADTNRTSPITNPDLAWLSIADKMLSSNHLGGGTEFSMRTYVSNFIKQREALGKQEGLRVDD